MPMDGTLVEVVGRGVGEVAGDPTAASGMRRSTPLEPPQKSDERANWARPAAAARSSERQWKIPTVSPDQAGPYVINPVMPPRQWAFKAKKRLNI